MKRAWARVVLGWVTPWGVSCCTPFYLSNKTKQKDTANNLKRSKNGKKYRTCRLRFGNKSTTVTQRIGPGLRIRPQIRGGIGSHILRLVILLPSENGAEQRQRLPGARGRLEQRVAVAVPLGSIERGDDSAHERQLRSVGLVGELDWDASDVVCVFRVSDWWF